MKTVSQIRQGAGPGELAPGPSRDVSRSAASAGTLGMESGGRVYQPRLTEPDILPAARGYGRVGVRARLSDYNPRPVPADTMPAPGNSLHSDHQGRFFTSGRSAAEGMAPPQRAPLGSRSRVSGASSKPITSRLQNIKEFLKRHGIPKPLRDIRIPVLNITLMRRDVAYKSLMARVDPALTAYHKTLGEAGAVTSQTPRKQAETVVELNARLDDLERNVMAAQRDWSDSKDLRGRALLDELGTAIDRERALLVDVANTFVAGQAGAAQCSWPHALEFKRVGLNVGSNVTTGASQGKVVKSTKAFGSGAMNTVHQVKFADASVGIFKQSVVNEGSIRAAVTYYLGINPDQPRYGARNVASVKLDKQLGAGVLVDAEFFVHNGQLGVLMEKAQGQTAGDVCMSGSDRMIDKLVTSPEFHRDLTNLQVLDAITGQHDRHFNNLLVETDARDNYVKLKGIDNDASFGSSGLYDDLSKLSDRSTNPAYLAGIHDDVERSAMQCSRNAGLPPLVDARLADRILAGDFLQQAQYNVKGLLSPKETEKLAGRIEQVQAHIRKLQSERRIVSDWSSEHADNGKPISEIFAEHPYYSYSQRFIRSVKEHEVSRRYHNAFG